MTDQDRSEHIEEKEGVDGGFTVTSSMRRFGMVIGIMILTGLMLIFWKTVYPGVPMDELDYGWICAFQFMFMFIFDLRVEKMPMWKVIYITIAFPVIVSSITYLFEAWM